MAVDSISQFKTSSTPAIVTTAADVAANDDRRFIFIQNLGQNALFVRLATSASTTVFTAVLKAGTANDDGTGGTFMMEGPAVYTGIISFAGTTPRYTISTDA